MNTTTTLIETEKRSSERSRSKLVPALRFNGFEGIWVKNKLIDWSLVVLDGDRGSNYPSGDEFQPEGYCLFMNAKNVTKTGFSFEHKMFITKEKDEILRKGKLKREDLVLTTRGSVGHIAYYDQSVPFDNLRINSGMVLIRNENDLISSKFIYINFFTPNLIKQVSTISFGSAQPQLTVKEINKFKFNIPSLPEQQKIASFLIAVDEKIQQLTKKKALLEQYKKGVMQQLFSGQLRFKDENGNPYPDWDWVGGNKLFNNISDKKHNSDLPILAITQDQGAIPRELINYTMTVTEASVASYKVVQKGDFIISLRTFQGGIEFSEYHGICSPAYNILRPSSEEVDSTFYKFYLKTSFYIKQLQKNLEGIRDGKMISYKYFSEIKIPFPSHPEQQKIATYLSSIDTKIEAVTHQITQTQTFKKGLLQQMFA